MECHSSTNQTESEDIGCWCYRERESDQGSIITNTKGEIANEVLL